MITFHNIEVQNFFSWGNTPTRIELDQCNLNLISGKSGSGKSSLLSSAIFFCLFGKMYKNVNKPSIVNSINGGGLKVSVRFSTNNKAYEVIRGMKPNIFEIKENGELLEQTADSKDYQAILEKNILRMNDKIFKQIVFVGSSVYVPFLKLPLMLRRDIIENILNVKIYSQMLDKLKKRIANLENQLTKIEYEITNVKGQIDIQEKMRKSLLENNRNKISNIRLEIDQIQGKKEKIENGIELLNNKIQKVLTDQMNMVENKAIKKHVDVMKSQITERKLKIKKINEELNFIGANDHCSACFQSINREFKEKFIVEKEAEKELLSSELATLVDQMESTNKTLAIVQEMESTMMALHQKLKELNNQIQWKEKDIQEIEKGFTTKLIDDEKLEKQLEEKTEARNKIFNELINCRSIIPLLKDNGVKSKVIRKYLPRMNKMLNEYLELLNLPVSFNLTEDFSEEIRSRYRDKFSYENFSDGEQARIDLSIMLLLREVSKLTNAIDTNLLVLDEADAALDEDSRKSFFNLYKRTLGNKNIFVISHHNDSESAEKYERVYHVENSGNFSSINVL
jgi:DNA repair exonuclease SbcCD ATPase subunit